MKFKTTKSPVQNVKNNYLKYSLTHCVKEKTYKTNSCLAGISLWSNFFLNHIQLSTYLSTGVYGSMHFSIK